MPARDNVDVFSLSSFVINQWPSKTLAYIQVEFNIYFNQWHSAQVPFGHILQISLQLSRTSPTEASFKEERNDKNRFETGTVQIE